MADSPTKETVLPTSSDKQPEVKASAAPAEFKYDTNQFNAKVRELEAARDSVAGKPGYNPFIWFRDNVQPAIDSVKSGKPDSMAIKRVLSLSATIPPLK